MALACVSLCILVLAGALLHLAWRLALLSLLWAPSAAAGFVCDWYVTRWTGSIPLGVAAAISAAALVRLAILNVWARLVAPRNVSFVAWTESR
jgi:hypothetical protein